MKIDTATAMTVGLWSLLTVICLGTAVGLFMALRVRRQRRSRDIAEARADARRWYEMLGGQLASLSAGDDPVASQALSDASQRYAEAAGQLAEARTCEQFHCVRRSATEGLRYIGAARARLGLVAGPQGPPPVAPDGRPMYEEGYWAAPGTEETVPRNERYKPRGSSAAVIARGVVRLMRHH
jgi:hypothetical protein